MFEQALQEIKRFDRIIIHRHNNPDGDAIGSQIGLKHIIKANFPEKEVLTVGDAAGRYSFMDDSVMDTVSDSAYDGALAIILDTSARSLISDTRYTLASRTLRIDHHIFVEKIADVEVTDSSFESCCGLVTQFAVEQQLTVPDIAAKSLYTGMVTDSGRFRYDSTNARTFRLASFLIGHDFNTNDIYASLYSDELSSALLRAKFTLKINVTDCRVGFIYTTRDELKELGCDAFTASRGMVGVMSDIKGIDISANFTETESGVLCELRSAKYNINPIAVKYGGGGHAKASGATLKSKAEAMAMLGDLNEMTGAKK